MKIDLGDSEPGYWQLSDERNAVNARIAMLREAARTQGRRAGREHLAKIAAAEVELQACLSTISTGTHKGKLAGDALASLEKLKRSLAGKLKRLKDSLPATIKKAEKKATPAEMAALERQRDSLSRRMAKKRSEKFTAPSPAQEEAGPDETLKDYPPTDEAGSSTVPELSLEQEHALAAVVQLILDYQLDPGLVHLELVKHAPRYRNPTTLEEWDGIGSRPAWLAAAVEQGLPHQQFIIDFDTGSGPAAPPALDLESAARIPRAGKPAVPPTLRPGLNFLGGRKPVRRDKSPRYRHPDTGQTWSGLGRKPAWLRDALESGATLESFSVE